MALKSTFKADASPATFIVARYMENGKIWYFDGVRFQEHKRNAVKYPYHSGALDIALVYEGFTEAL
jgi:hypothetical protein